MIFLLFGLVLPALVSSLGVIALHYTMGGVVLVGNLAFVLLCVRETRGLTDRQKKALYSK